MHLRDLPYPDPGDPDIRSGTRFMLWLGRRQLGGQLKALLWGLVNQLSIAALPLGVGLAVQAVADGSGSGLARAAGLILLLGAAVALGETLLHRATTTNWTTAATRIQQLLARKTAELGAVLTRRVAAGEVMAVSSADVEKVGWFVEVLSRFTAAATALVAVCTGLVLYQPELGTLVAVGVPVIALASLPLLPAASRRADRQRERAGYATELASDTVAGLRVLRGIGGERLFLARYRAASQEVRSAAVRSARVWALIGMVQVILPGLLMLAVVGQGAALALDGRIAVGELVTVYSAVLLTQYPLRGFAELALAYAYARPSARRTARVLALSRTDTGAGTATAADPWDGPEDPEGPEPATPPRGDLYDPLTGVLAPGGRLTAVVCGDPDTAGELADRLGGHPVDGAGAGTGDRPSVLLGGVPLDALPLECARAAVLVQDTEPVLLSGTLRELLDVPSSGRIPVAAALSAAQCGDVLDTLGRAADGGDAMAARITERGRSLSGGQRQRLALARSLVADPPVLVLDEPTSAVDAHTEARIAEGLGRLRRDRTTVVFTSSPLLLTAADRVVLVDGDAVVATGTHRELLRDEPRYRSVVARDPGDGGPDGGDGTPCGPGWTTTCVTTEERR
ncbi:ABC transporter transmembrane domain-containing protein [Streptomyces clavuligerus]|uniref:Putative ABC transporter ATPase and permease component n=1 Tax=Streptomyces clavuligerus TaxID=1901 RepID=E2Q9E7_STRCL|nr:ABC transporter ATP-binding protein [Streptomyces clavuligerus]EFG05567.1 Putative ABC transporter ATPase and permease component [Streptomyces clavuligerus]MBY6306064.1 ABC transporter ATP-binding protein [Streptomyces clavuligerus]QCS08717.1 ABC transporter ATP-binding protein [Streptomyces clavuligerus]QPJ91947.1 ATP-binding cassette domain-containing protein [Streptomyces clavuligerus]WDN50788.1 ABC transporter ATP-binding protein/permease [Streptomyces clavuligerus]